MSTKCKMLTQALALELLRYEPETGKLFWRQRDRKHFPTDRICRIWNTRYADREALTGTLQGYRVGRVLDVSQRAHRVIWLMVHGCWPDEIDHLDGDPSNNRIENLRDVNSSINKRNRMRSSNNKSGVTGVFYCTQAGKYAAKIKADGKTTHLGFFDDIEKAAQVRADAEQRMGFTKRHGKAA